LLLAVQHRNGQKDGGEYCGDSTWHTGSGGRPGWRKDGTRILKVS